MAPTKTKAVVQHACVECGKPSTKQCSRCKAVYYCSADCQKAGWKLHKKTCGKVVATGGKAAHVDPMEPLGEMIGQAAALQVANVAALMVEEEERWEAGGGANLCRNTRDYSPSDLKLARAAAASPAAVADAIGPFIQEALGAASAAAHDAAARALTMLVQGSSQRRDRAGNPMQIEPKVMALVSTCMEALHKSPRDAVATPAALYRSIHEVMELEDDDGRSHLLFALPALTREGATVLPMPPAVLSAIRSSYFEVLERGRRGGACENELGMPADPRSALNLPTDPAATPQLATDVPPLYDGDRFESAPEGRRPRPDAPAERSFVEWAALPAETASGVVEALRPLVAEWCGHELGPGRFFGVRRNLAGATLCSHVDHEPKERAIGVSITVDIENLQAPWLLAGAGAGGQAGGTLPPVGYCFVYEACRVKHYRESPLRAGCFANCFVHYTLKDWA